MNRKNESISLRKWVDKAKNSGILLLTKFAKGIEKEFDAVQTAVDFQWSNGVVEGNVNRIKNIKRMMYLRANLELLKRKTILSNR